MSQTSKRGLGRGFEALLPADFDKNLLLSPEERIEKIPLAQLKANPHQPRKHFDEAALQELAISIKNHGLLQPLIVTPRGSDDKNYLIIAGERRWRAAKSAGLKAVPAIIRSTKELEQLEMALIENVQRVDLTPLEQAITIERLRDQFSLPYQTIAKRLGKAVSTINNTVRLLQLPAEVQSALAAHKISEGHARAILALKGDIGRQTYLLKAILDNGWSVRQAERFVSGIKSGHHQPRQAHARVSTETAATKALAKRLETDVQIRRTARGGKLEISFKTDQELNRLLDSFK